MVVLEVQENKNPVVVRSITLRCFFDNFIPAYICNWLVMCFVILICHVESNLAHLIQSEASRVFTGGSVPKLVQLEFVDRLQCDMRWW